MKYRSRNDIARDLFFGLGAQWVGPFVPGKHSFEIIFLIILIDLAEGIDESELGIKLGSAFLQQKVAALLQLRVLAEGPQHQAQLSLALELEIQMEHHPYFAKSLDQEKWSLWFFLQTTLRAWIERFKDVKGHY